MPISGGYPGMLEGASGEEDGSATAVQLPNVPCQLAWIKAVRSNAGNVYIGYAGVTKVDGTTDTTTGFELDAGEVLGPLTIDNLNRLFLISDNAGDDITYFVLR